MIIDRKKAQQAFAEYVACYDVSNKMIKLKIDHTYRVCALCEQIAKRSGYDDTEIEIAWLLGLLHDIGRFEQVRQYDTFMDAQSVDHAKLGVSILFHERKIRNFIEECTQDSLIEHVIGCHSAYRVPAEYSEREKKFANLLRDADKIDIIKVNSMIPFEQIYHISERELRDCVVSEEVMQAFWEEHAVLRSLKKTPVDNIVGHISLVYELVYPVSYQILYQQNCLEKIMDFRSELSKTNEQFEQIRTKMKAYIAKKIEEGA